MGQTQTLQKKPIFTNHDLRVLIIPLIIEQLLFVTVGLADSLMVAQVGEAAVSGVSLVDTVNVLMVNVFAALGTGGAVVAGQYLGRREPEKANRSAVQLMLLMIEISLVITAAMYLCRDWILTGVFGQITPEVADYANTYYLIVQASIPFLAVYSAGAALFRVMGNSGICMKVSMVMNLVNVVGNAILIFGFHRGVEGVAIPTLISRVVAAVLMLVLLRDEKLLLHLEKKFSLHHDRQMIRNILRFGIPNGVENSMFQLGKILLLSVIATFGTASVAANAIGNTICIFQALPGLSIGLVVLTVVSRCVGAGDYEMARVYTKKLCLYANLGNIVFSAVTILLLPLCLKLYNVSDEAARLASFAIISHGLCAMFIHVPSFTLPYTLRAAGDTPYTMLVSTASMWLFRVALGVYLARQMGLGMVGAWVAMYVDWIVRSSFFYLRYRGQRWELKSLKD